LRQVASKVLGHMRLELRAKLREREDTVLLELSGQDASYFLDNDGEPLDALQHVLNKILSRDERFTKRVVVDCEGFRSRRDEELVARARKAADEAIATGEAQHLEGLNPYERRLVHIDLAERGGVRTYSTGSGAIRRLTIEPTGEPRDDQGGHGGEGAGRSDETGGAGES